MKQGLSGMSSPNIATPAMFNQFTPAGVSHLDLAQRIREARMKGTSPMNREGGGLLSTVDQQLIALANNYAYVSKNLQRELEVQKKIVKEKILLVIDSEKRQHQLRKELQKKDLKIAMLRNQRGGYREEIAKLRDELSKRDQKYKALRTRANKKLKLKNQHIAGLKKIIDIYEHGAPSSQRQMQQQSWMYPVYPQAIPYGYQPPPYSHHPYPYYTPTQALTPDGSHIPIHSAPPQPPPQASCTQLPSPELSRIAKAMESVNPMQSFCTAGVQQFATPKGNQKNKTFSRNLQLSGERSGSFAQQISEQKLNRRSKSADYASSGFPYNSLQSGGGGGRRKSILVQQRLDALLKQAASLTKFSQMEEEEDQLLQDQTQIESKQSPLRKLLQQQNASPIIEESSRGYHSTQKTNEYNRHSSQQSRAKHRRTGLDHSIDSERFISVSVLDEGSRQPQLDPHYSFSRKDNDMSSILSHQELVQSTPSKQRLHIQVSGGVNQKSMEDQVKYLKTRRENIERDLIHSEPRLSASGGTHSVASTPHRAPNISPSQKFRQISQRS